VYVYVYVYVYEPEHDSAPGTVLNGLWPERLPPVRAPERNGDDLPTTATKGDDTMKVYISADIEGCTLTTAWEETGTGKPGYEQACEQMTAEVAAACEGLLEAGADEVWVKDAHATGRNIRVGKLPEKVKVVRGWSGHPLSMVQELDESFDAAVMIGYHSGAGASGNPLSHTMSGHVASLTVNGQCVSEFLLHAYAAACADVPIVLVSGDAGLCEEIGALNPNIGRVSVKEGIGNSTVCVHPKVACRAIREGAARALSGDLAACRIELPDRFDVEIAYKDHWRAYRASFFPGARAKGMTSIVFEARDCLDVLRLILFVCE